MSIEFLPAQGSWEREAKIAVIAARYEGKWLLCRHKERDTWELPGGHREENESIEETARRELYEETGAVEMKLHLVTPYQVSRMGALYFADVAKLEKIPERSEIAEVKLFDALPLNLTYPGLHGPMFHRVQGWLNLQSKADELWDVYDENRQLKGYTHRRGDPMPDGDYHLVVFVGIVNSRGEFLITKRSPNKGYPNMWEMTGGSALAGDDSLTAALREVEEETGLKLDPASGKVVEQHSRKDSHCDVWVFRHEFDLKNVVLQEGETCDARAATAEDIRALQKEGQFVPCSYLEYILAEA